MRGRKRRKVGRWVRKKGVLKGGRTRKIRGGKKKGSNSARKGGS
jgi:hypothetical protein